MGLVIAVLLALTAGIVAVSAPQAAALAGRQALTALDLGHGHGSHAHKDATLGHDHETPVRDKVSAKGDCDDPASGAHGGAGADCCSMGACHAFQVAAAPVVHAPVASAASLTLVGDEQVEGVIAGGLDRPPRTI